MSTQNRSSGSRNQKKSNSAGGVGGGGDSNSQASIKKTDASKTEKEKVQLKPTAEQLRIAQITNSNAAEDPHIREKVAALLEMTERSEEEVCCALNECDNNLERAAEYLFETLPVGAFETSSKKRKNKAANAVQENAGGDGGDWGDVNANSDRREKSRNRSSNRGGRGGTDSRGWRGREARENERNLQDSRGDRGGDRSNDNYRSGSRGGRGGGRGGGYVGRGGRSGISRIGGGRGGGDRRGDRDRGGYSSRQNNNDDHQEVELWDNTIAQNAEKQQQQSASDDAWGEWDNDEYVSLKDSKVFTSSNIQNQATSGIVSGVGIVGNNTDELSAPPGLEHHLTTSANAASISPSQQGNSLNALGSGGSVADDNTSLSTTPSMMQYSGAVNSQIQPQTAVTSISAGNMLSSTSVPQYAGSTAESFSSSSTANLVQHVQQQQQQQPPPQLKSSATLSAEQSQYFNSLTSQSAAAAAAAASSVQQTQQQLSGVNVNAYAAQTAGVQYPASYANVFGTGNSTSVPNSSLNQTQMSSSQQPQVRRLRAKLPPPSKIPSTAVEMPGDALNNIGYLDVQFGALDFGPEDSFDNLPEKFNAAVDQQQQQQQQQHLVQSQQDAANDYSAKANVQQQQAAAAAAVLSAGLQNSQIGDTLSTTFVPRGSSSVQQQPQVVANVVGGGGGNSSTVGSSALDQFSKTDPYNQSNSSGTSGYQSSYQTNAATKAASAYQQTSAGQGYQSANYANAQSSIANSYQPQSYGSYQQNSVNTYQQQQQQQQVNANVSIQNTSNAASVGNASSSGGGSSSNNISTQNIPVGNSSNNNNASGNSNTGYLSAGYQSQQSAYQSQSVYGSSGLSNSSGFSGSASTLSSQYSNFSTNTKLKDTSTTPSSSHFDSVSSSGAASSSGTAAISVSNAVTSQATSTNSMSSSSVGGLSNTKVTANSSTANNNNASSSVVSAGSLSSVSGSNNNSSSNSSSNSAATSAVAAAAAAAAASNKSNSTASGTGGMVPNIQMVSQYIQTGLPYYQQPVYSYEEIQMMQQRVPHVQGYYDLNYTPTSLGAGRDNLGSVAYSTMTDGRFARTDNNSSPVSNVSSTMSQQAGSGGPMLNVPYAYFYGGNMMPGSFQYGTPAIYPQQIPAANTASGGQFPKPSYNTGYSSTSYDTLSQASQDYTKGAYPSSVNQQTKSQNVTNPPQAGTGSDITSSMYGKGHVTLNKVNSYEKQNFHSGTPPPFNMPNTQTAGGTSAQPYGMYLPMPAAGHHNMIHQPIHQMDGRIHNPSRRDSNSTGQRQQTSSQSKSATKQGYSPSYWTGQN